jgi:hypothetical protein
LFRVSTPDTSTFKAAFDIDAWKKKERLQQMNAHIPKNNMFNLYKYFEKFNMCAIIINFYH